ncbi:MULTISPECIES: RidA family protein [Acinetobacter]|nr:MULTISPECIES: Rid family hydrolase [Acinetobacter]ENV54887.1 hypothetical protein F952_00969 [Acinetobacter baylyi DSM 14961 = CIP 107474]KAF2370188.1 YjgF family translation initiation inhibitor [Acinetobacter baylyi]KAF2371303.1 YjgF family translation initiation inhibitor [Acinetobacter baylyi]KAF2378114.1 YjgF family translation initiation inhibitor [Acinetobacter baylyi]KAF2379645.1 YjgF family translation initiation inhibitor [Acinetobacter baylyi]
MSCKSVPFFQVINPETLYNPQAFAYSHIVEITHVQRILHIAGQGGENQAGEISADFSQQVWQAFHNVKRALQYMQASIHHIAMLRLLIVNHDTSKHQVVIKIMQTLWPEQNFPACTLIPVTQLALPSMQFEVEATAYTH